MLFWRQIRLRLPPAFAAARLAAALFATLLVFFCADFFFAVFMVNFLAMFSLQVAVIFCLLKTFHATHGELAHKHK